MKLNLLPKKITPLKVVIAFVVMMILVALQLNINSVTAVTPSQAVVAPPPGSGIPEQTEAVKAGEMVKGITAILSAVAGFFFAISAWLLDYVFSLSKLDEIIKLFAVQKGWEIVRDFTNLGFVLAIIVMAFATIFRFQSYAMKQTLWKLIIAALLVNFSLAIAGAFISVSDTVSSSFLNASGVSSNQYGNISTLLANALGPQELFKITDVSAISLLTGFEKILKFITSLVFIIIFTVLGIISFLAIAIMLLVRYLALAILLIFSPMIWLMWIFPYTQEWWKKWWQEFLRWTFFAPILFFFIYLALATLSNNQAQSSSGPIDISGGLEAANSQTFIENDSFKERLSNAVILVGILFGGLFAANSLGIYGAKTAMNIAQGVGRGAGAWAGRLPLRAGSAALKPWGWGEKVGGAIRRGGDKLSKITGFGWAGRGLSVAGGGMQRAATYKPLSLFQNIRSNVAKQRGAKEYIPYDEQMQKELDSLMKKDSNLEKGLTRIATRIGTGKGQITQEQYDRIEKNVNGQRKKITEAVQRVAGRF